MPERNRKDNKGGIDTPTFYEGKPIEAVEQTVNAADYASAYYVVQSSLSLMHKREVKAGICLSLAVITGSIIPIYHAKFFTFWGPFCGIFVLLGLAAVFFFVQPNDIKNWAKELYRSNALLALPEKIIVYRDSIVADNGRERFTEYWTDFYGCIETKDAFIMNGGMERNLLIIKKEGLSTEQKNKLSTHFADTFASRFQKTGR